MDHRIYQASIATAILGAAFAIGCGSDDDKDTGSSGPSYSELSAQISEPTGTVSSTTVGPVAQEFASMSSSGLAGFRDYAQTQTSEQACPAGGSMTASGSGSESSGNVSIDYNNCCEVANCCFNGNAHVAYDSANGSSMNYCANYSVQGTCEGESLSIDYALCMQADGTVAYSVEVAGETFTVSGSYAAGSGQLTITGANGTWTCTYTNDTGTCTGTGGDFTF